jgi:cystathionine gamma-synthase/methionine-gamma-lyase
MDEIVEGELEDFVYSRYGNPTVRALETALAEIEGANFARAFASGMAAIHAALLSCELRSGSVIIFSRDIYGSTVELVRSLLTPFGVRAELADFGNEKELEEKISQYRPRAIFCETISNPLLRCTDIERCAELAKKHKAVLIVDNTFATPVICRPIEFGADLVVHSATKFLGGHADATGGVTAAGDEVFLQPLLSVQSLAGAVMSPFEANSIRRGMKTLAIRIERQCENAVWLAEKFGASGLFSEVIHPSLFTGKDLAAARKTLGLQTPCPIISVRLKDDTRQAAYAFLNRLNLCTRATSVGDIFTGVVHPATATHREFSPKLRASLGITEGLLRISVGIEDRTEIFEDIKQAALAASQQLNKTKNQKLHLEKSWQQ